MKHDKRKTSGIRSPWTNSPGHKVFWKNVRKTYTGSDAGCTFKAILLLLSRITIVMRIRTIETVAIVIILNQKQYE